MDVTTLVCLANSRKYQGRCVAGKALVGGNPGPWLRPVSDRPMGELSRGEGSYRFGGQPKLLDIIEMPLGEPPARSLAYQTENRLLVPGARWKKTGSFPWGRLAPFLDTPRYLWQPGNSSMYGVNDRVALAEAERFTSSLLLIEPQELLVRKCIEGADFEAPRRRLRACFRYRGLPYLLAVTDPVAERVFADRADGDYPLPHAYLCVSLGEPHEGHCYKLAAGILGMRRY